MPAANLTVAVNVTGNLTPIVEALALMTRALDAHGHEWTDEERVVCAEAVRLCEEATVKQLDA